MKIVDGIGALEEEMTATRRDIHANPEIGYQEVRTSGLVADKLKSWGIEVHGGYGKTGLAGVLRGRKEGSKRIGLRADMDCLHIEELTNLPYASKNKGKMHACGHDGHTAMLLGAAHHLALNPDFAGEVCFIFQPAEEGGAGAQAMVDDGLFSKFPCERVYGMHNMPDIPQGHFGIRPGPIMAAADRWTVTFNGTGGHGGANVHLSTDPIMALGQFITAVQTIVSRSVPALDSAVVSIGHVAGGTFGSPNVIPASVLVRGTTRTFTEETRKICEIRMKELADGIAAANRVEAVVDHAPGYPPLRNDADCVRVAAETARELVGAEQVDDNLEPITASEDFGYLLGENRPGAFIMIGGGKPGGKRSPGIHTPDYDFNDGILTLGASYWVKLVQRELVA